MSLSALRENTKLMHSDLEKSLNLFEKIQNQSQYLQHLQKYYSWLSPLEAALDGHAKDLEIGWASRKRADSLAKDIQNLGGVIKSKQEFKPPLLNPSSKAEALGILYVIEGSTLGGQFICKHFATILNLAASNGLSFYHGRGFETGKMWKEFLNTLETYMNENPQTVNDTYKAANQTFASIKAALC